MSKRRFPLLDSSVRPVQLGFDRRRFLEGALGVLGATGFQACDPLGAKEQLIGETVAPLPAVIPPHRAITIPGFHAYADRDSYTPGETVSLMISNDANTAPYDLEIIRFGNTVDSVSADTLLSSFPRDFSFETQPIHPGSYVHVGAGLTANSAITGLTLECWVRPLRLDLWAGLIAQHNYPNACGIGVFVGPGGSIIFYTGDGGGYRSGSSLQAPGVLAANQWHHVVCTWNGTTRAIWVNGTMRTSAGSPGHTIYAGGAPLRLAAYGENGAAVNFLNGDLSLPAIYTRALSSAEIATRYQDGGRSLSTLAGRWAAWPLSEERGATVADPVGGHNGSIINTGTWMIGGPSHDPDIGPYTDPFRGRCLRFLGGSHVHAVSGLSPTAPMSALSLECWVRPRSIAWTGLICQHDYPDRCGYGLFINASGGVEFNLGNGGAWQANPMRTAAGTIQVDRWYHIIGTFDGGSRSLYINGVRVRGPESFSGPVIAGYAPLRVGAYGDRGVAGQFFDGDILMPAIYSRALTPAEISQRLEGRGQTAPALAGLHACWPLGQASGTSAPEITGVRPGELLHLGAPKWLPGSPGNPLAGRSLKLHPGDYVDVPTGLPAASPIPAMTIECWVRPLDVSAWVGILTQHDFPNRCGYGLFIKPNGIAVFYAGTGAAYSSSRSVESGSGALSYGRWHHVAGVWNGVDLRIYVNGQQAGTAVAVSGTVAAGSAPIRIGAYLASGVTGQFLNGDVAMPVIHNRALSAGEIALRHSDGGRNAPSSSVTACWPLAEAAGTNVAETTGARPGTLRPANTTSRAARWASGSPSGDRLSEYDPAADPDRGHALRFASDDLYDCRWNARQSYTIPANTASGLYAARFRVGSYLYHAPFVIRRSMSAPRARILVLAAMNTWRAYNSHPFAGLRYNGQFERWSTDGPLDHTGALVPPNPNVPDHPTFSCYREHGAAGQPTFQVGLRMPFPAASPFAVYTGTGGTNYSHLMRAERFTHAWLGRSNYTYDLATDLDLHRDPAMLIGYRAVIIAGHSEYWSIPMYEGLQQYLNSGGNVLSLSANSIFWRVSFDDDMTVMECRKIDSRVGGQVDANHYGMAWHSQDGARGGLMREAGYPSVSVLGTETLGWINQDNFNSFGDYRVLNAAHPLFTGPYATGLVNNSRFGAAASRRAIGHEFDLTWQRMVSLRNARDTARFAGQPIFEHVAMEVAGPNPSVELAGISLLADTTISPATAFDMYAENLGLPGDPAVPLCAELIDWRRPSGGRVVNLSSVGAGWALDADPALQNFIRNVLHAFGV
jgi:hypothetical protein